MSKFYRFWAVTLLTVLGVFIPASAAASQPGIDFSIRLFDRRIYYVHTDPVFVQVTIANNSPNTYRFRLADERAFSINFDARTMTNMPLEPSHTFIRRRTQHQQIFYREIAIGSGESFSFVEDLRDFVNLSQPGSFVVQARIYPELYRGGTMRPFALHSNRLNLTLRPPAIRGRDGIPVEMDVDTGAVLVRQRLAPDQVVEYMLVARQRSQWERFFLYLDLEAMLARDPYRRRRWLAESEEGRRRMVADFRRELQETHIDGTISVIPTSFTMERTTYNNFEGTVTMLQRFDMGNFTVLRRYTYYLEQRDNIWFIVNYTVTNLGTE